MKKRIIAAVAVFGLLGGILYFAYAQTAAQNNVKHFTAFFAVEGESIDQNNDIKKEIARLTGADCEEQLYCEWGISGFYFRRYQSL